MKIALFCLGLIAGLAIWAGPRYIESYAARGLPAPYQGPKYRHWRGGKEIT